MRKRAETVLGVGLPPAEQVKLLWNSNMVGDAGIGSKSATEILRTTSAPQNSTVAGGWLKG